MKIFFNSLIAICFWFGHASVSHAISIKINGDMSVVISADVKKCTGVDETRQDVDVPDAPPRFLNLGKNGVLGFSTHYNNILYRGRSINELSRQDCKSVFVSGKNSDPSMHSALEWLVSPILLENGVIYSLVHNEYQGARYDDICRERLPAGAPLWYPVCIYGTITAAISFDNGNSFQKVQGPLKIVAAPPEKFRTDSRWYGVHDPSNIIKNPKDNYYYFTANSPGFAQMEQGVCVFRTKDPLVDPWLAWDGNDFSLRMNDAYGVNKSTGKSCKSVFSHAISGITFNTLYDGFIGVGGEKEDGIYISFSKDLVTWNKLIPILNSKPMYVWSKNDINPPSFYYSLIDPDSSASDYGLSGENLYLYMIQWRVQDGRMQSRKRDVVRIPLKIIF